MQKLSNTIIDKMITMQLTSAEVNYMIFISRFQDDNGRVRGVYYRELCQEMDMSYQTFYNVKESLVKKGFITCHKENKIDHDITIVNNIFKDKADINKGYVNTNHKIFYDKNFLKLKAGAKLLAMEIIRMSYAGKGQFKIGKQNFYDKYTKMFQVSKRVIRTYLMSLKEFFSIGIVLGNYYMRPKSQKVYRQPEQRSEADHFLEHNITAAFRRQRIDSITGEEFSDLITIYHQHKHQALKFGKDMLNLLYHAIEQSVEVLKDKLVRPKLIHKLIIEELAN